MPEFNLFKEWARMVKANDKGLCTIECDTCDFYKPAGDKSCASYVRSHPEEAEAIIRKWAEKHPRKTRQSEFLKMYPNAARLTNGVVDVCPSKVDKDYPCTGACPSCKDRYWKEEV